jgi:hypothetical protein
MKRLIIAILLVLLGFVCFVQGDFDQEVVAATLIMEAGGEYDEGALEAVYEVIHNRAMRRGTQYSDECLRRLQFSCWNGITPEEGIEKASKHPRWNEALKLAYYKPMTNYTKGADHYHADYVNPYWAKKLQKTSIIGRHIFYK